MDVNLFGTMQMTYAALPHLKEQDDSRVIMVNSQAAQVVQERFVAYAASKGALAVATQGLARELGRYGVRVNGIHPSYIWGKSVEWYVNDMADQAGRRLPGGVRRAGRPDLPQVPAVVGRDRRGGGVLRIAAGQGRDRPEPERELRRVPVVTAVTERRAGDLAGRVALVTGGASGIGRATCELFVRRGASVMVADLDAERAAATAAELGDLVPDGGGTVDSVVVDVAVADQVQAMVAATVSRLGGLDAAVNNAGHARHLQTRWPTRSWPTGSAPSTSTSPAPSCASRPSWR